MNNKMIRVAKVLDVSANVGGKITAGLGAICILIAFFTLIFGGKMFTNGAITLDIDFLKFYLKDNSYVNVGFIKAYVIAACFGGGIMCLLIYYISKLLRRVLVPMKSGRPFEAGISENLRKVGWAVLAGGLLHESVGVIARVLLSKAYSIKTLFASAEIVKTEFVFTMNFDFVLIACVIFFLSYVFTYGQALQQESDETL